MIRLISTPMSKLFFGAPLIAPLSIESKVNRIAVAALNYSQTREGSSGERVLKRKSKKTKATSLNIAKSSPKLKDKKLIPMRLDNKSRALKPEELKAFEDITEILGKRPGRDIRKGLSQPEIDKLSKVRVVLGRMCRSGTILPPNERTIVDAVSSPFFSGSSQKGNEMPLKLKNNPTLQEIKHYKAMRNIITKLLRPYIARQKLAKQVATNKKIASSSSNSLQSLGSSHTVKAVKNKEDVVMGFLKTVVGDLREGKHSKKTWDQMQNHLNLLKTTFKWGVHSKGLSEDIRRVQQWSHESGQLSLGIPNLVVYASSLEPKFLDYYLFVTGYLKICSFRSLDEKHSEDYARQVGGFRNLCAMIEEPLVKDALLGLWTIGAPLNISEKLKTYALIETERIQEIVLDYLREKGHKPATDSALIGYYPSSEAKNRARAKKALEAGPFAVSIMYIQEIPRGSLRDQTIQTLLNNLSEIPDAKKERVEYLAYLASTPELKAWIFEKAKELKTK